jgi:hypothetical protein
VIHRDEEAQGIGLLQTGSAVMDENESNPVQEQNPSNRATLRDFLDEMKSRDELITSYIETRSKQHHLWTVVVGFATRIVDIWVVVLISQMMDDMQIMSQKMVAMEGYMRNMQSDMGSMNESMGNMEDAIIPMSGYMRVMAEDIGGMRGDIASVPAMQKDVGRMSESVNRMQYDTGAMRYGVSNMSNDMGAMSFPFRNLNSVTPW